MCPISPGVFQESHGFLGRVDHEQRQSSPLQLVWRGTWNCSCGACLQMQVARGTFEFRAQNAEVSRTLFATLTEAAKDNSIKAPGRSWMKSRGWHWFGEAMETAILSPRSRIKYSTTGQHLIQNASQAVHV